ncbi:MAG: aminoacyl-tRNA hydrolase [Crocinitomicaceae bacterium]|nr:aminoacyl-tRNA hydrolase [Crocinitomicaceae bacterium]
MKFLLTGLGNIGPEYENTRHNVGFTIVEKLAADAGQVFSTGRYASRCEFRHKGKTFVLIRPSTFMNLSGNAVRYWMQEEKIPLENVMIITDDIALPYGKIRMRAGGSDGGHNGLKHIAEVLGTDRFPRLRFGIGAEFSKGRQADYVLGKWSAEEQETLSERVETATKACLSFGLIGLPATMNEFNRK